MQGGNAQCVHKPLGLLFTEYMCKQTWVGTSENGFLASRTVQQLSVNWSSVLQGNCECYPPPPSKNSF